MSFRDKCIEYFDTSDLYEILNIRRDAAKQEIKKAYHKLSLRVHPDRVAEKDKLVATEKFKVLSKVHSVLQDADKRRIYDENGNIDDDDDDASFNWMDYWRSLFKPITTDDINRYKREYIGSETELRDIRKAYISSKGNMNHIHEMVGFCNLESEERIRGIVRRMVDAGEVEEYDSFFKEPRRKYLQRKRRLEREAAEADTEMSDADLQRQILENSEQRCERFANLMESIEAKYVKKRKSIQAMPSTSSSSSSDDEVISEPPPKRRKKTVQRGRGRTSRKR